MIVIAFFILLLVIVMSSYLEGYYSWFVSWNVALIRFGLLFLFWAGVCLLFFISID